MEQERVARESPWSIDLGELPNSIATKNISKLEQLRLT